MENYFSEGNLSEVRLEIIEALNTFHTHVRYTITLMTSVLAGSVASIKYVEVIGVASKELVSAVMFLLVPILAYFSIKICRRYYKIYAANYIYYARIHRAEQELFSHPWVSDLERHQKIDHELLYDADALDKFIKSENSSDPNSWFYYRPVIIFLGFFGFVGFLLMVLEVLKKFF